MFVVDYTFFLLTNLLHVIRILTSIGYITENKCLKTTTMLRFVSSTFVKKFNKEIYHIYVTSKVFNAKKLD